MTTPNSAPQDTQTANTPDATLDNHPLPLAQDHKNATVNDSDATKAEAADLSDASLDKHNDNVANESADDLTSMPVNEATDIPSDEPVLSSQPNDLQQTDNPNNDNGESVIANTEDSKQILKQELADQSNQASTTQATTTQATTEQAVNASAQANDAEKVEVKQHTLPSHVKLTGRMLNFTRLHIQGNDISDILVKVEKKLGAKRQSKLPVVVSCEHELELAKLWEGLWQLGLQPIGIVTGLLDVQAQAMPIAIFPADGQRIDGKASKKSDPVSHQEHTKDKPQHTSASQTASDSGSEAGVQPDDKLSIASESVSHVEGDLVHAQMLRSGQSINHVGGDLVLIGGINAGAEAITDYSLHVYGKAEGRLVAGATGDKNAKIFCLRFNPSLVSVAGTYCLRENIPAEMLNKAVQVSYVEGQGLVFTLMQN